MTKLGRRSRAALVFRLVGPRLADIYLKENPPLMEEVHQLLETYMVEKLFASPALYATLALSFDYPHDPLFPRRISRYTGTDIKSVLRELKKLQEIGILRNRRTRKERHYRLNEDFPLHEELASIFDKTRKYRPGPLAAD